MWKQIHVWGTTHECGGLCEHVCGPVSLVKCRPKPTLYLADRALAWSAASACPDLCALMELCWLLRSARASAKWRAAMASMTPLLQSVESKFLHPVSVSPWQ